MANQLKIQDTFRFKTSEEFLRYFKTTNGEMFVSTDGIIRRQENLELSDITLEEALRITGKEQLYVEQEDRVYDSALYLNWHQRYLDSVAHSLDEQEQDEYGEDQEIRKISGYNK